MNTLCNIVNVCQLKFNLNGNSTLKQSVPLALWCEAKDIFSSGVVSQGSLACKTKVLVCFIYIVNNPSITKYYNINDKNTETKITIPQVHCASKSYIK